MMRAKLHRLKQRMRSLVQNVASTCLHWSGKIGSDSFAITWHDNVRWFLESKFERVFDWAYDGSDEEIQAVFQAEIPPVYMSERQRAEFDKFDHSEIPAHCVQPRRICDWAGMFSECKDSMCPRCGKVVWIESFEEDVA